MGHEGRLLLGIRIHHEWLNFGDRYLLIDSAATAAATTTTAAGENHLPRW
jgi:hypothetical protein